MRVRVVMRAQVRVRVIMRVSAKYFFFLCNDVSLGPTPQVVVSTDSLAVGMVDRERGPAFLNNYGE